MNTTTSHYSKKQITIKFVGMQSPFCPSKYPRTGNSINLPISSTKTIITSERQGHSFASVGTKKVTP